MLVFEVICFGTGIFVLTGLGVGAGSPFSAIQINCISYNSLWLKPFQSFITLLVRKLSISVIYYNFLIRNLMHFLLPFTYKFCIPIKLIFTCSSLNIFERTFSLLTISAIIFIMVSSEIDIWGFLLNFGIPDKPPCYVRQCSLMLSIVLNFF